MDATLISFALKGSVPNGTYYTRHRLAEYHEVIVYYIALDINVLVVRKFIRKEPNVTSCRFVLRRRSVRYAALRGEGLNPFDGFYHGLSDADHVPGLGAPSNCLIHVNARQHQACSNPWRFSEREQPSGHGSSAASADFPLGS